MPSTWSRRNRLPQHCSGVLRCHHTTNNDESVRAQIFELHPLKDVGCSTAALAGTVDFVWPRVRLDIYFVGFTGLSPFLSMRNTRSERKALLDINVPSIVTESALDLIHNQRSR